jgi:hypothetical protein
MNVMLFDQGYSGADACTENMRWGEKRDLSAHNNNSIIGEKRET